MQEAREDKADQLREQGICAECKLALDAPDLDETGGLEVVHRCSTCGKVVVFNSHGLPVTRCGDPD